MQCQRNIYFGGHKFDKFLNQSQFNACSAVILFEGSKYNIASSKSRAPEGTLKKFKILIINKTNKLIN